MGLPAIVITSAESAHPFLQTRQGCFGLGYLSSEGEIILSSSGIKLGCWLIIHAGGAGGVWHSWAGCLDAQPLTTSSNISSKPVILLLGIL